MNFADSENSWSVDLADINQETWDLTVKNPNRVEEVDEETPQEIIRRIARCSSCRGAASHQGVAVM